MALAPFRFFRGVQWPDLRALATRAAQLLVGLVLPPRCAWCQGDTAELPGGIMLCADCQQLLAGATKERCGRCGGIVATTAATCPHCHGRKWRFDAVVPLGAYTGALRECVLRLKSPGHEALAKSLGDLLAVRQSDHLAAAQADAVMAVPMHWARRFVRRSNSAELLAAALAVRLARPLWHRPLRRVRNTRK